jgi:hypothetical protein
MSPGPDCDLAPFIEIRKAYHDRKSFEKSTNRTKKKFKLAGDSVAELGVFTFFLIFGEIAALKKALTLTIKREDWEDRVSNELNHDESYVDISQVESLTREEIQIKRDDPENGFAPIATLRNRKFLDLKRLTKKLRNPEVAYRVSKETKRLICYAFATEKDLMKKLGL